MPSVFDELAGQTFATISNLMGVEAVWRSSRKERATGTVLFKDPSDSEKIGDADYYPDSPTAEYYEGTFPGLKKEADKNTSPQYLSIEGVKYQVLRVRTKSDGKTYVAYLQPTV